MDRAEDRDRIVEWEQVAEHRVIAAPVEPYDEADVEDFPVMVRLSQIQSQISHLTQTVERLSQTIERLERAVADRAFSLRGWRAEEPFPRGVTARPNPMTHPVTPLSAMRPMDNSREEALASVRTLFQQPSRPWWQRLPELLRG